MAAETRVQVPYRRSSVVAQGRAVALQRFGRSTPGNSGLLPTPPDRLRSTLRLARARKPTFSFLGVGARNRALNGSLRCPSHYWAMAHVFRGGLPLIARAAQKVSRKPKVLGNEVVRHEALGDDATQDRDGLSALGQYLPRTFRQF